MKSTIYALAIATSLFTAGCAAMINSSEIPSANLNTVSEVKTAYLEKVKRLDCVTAGVLDMGCYQMKKAAKEGFEDAFVDAGNGVFVLDTMKLEYLQGLEVRPSPPVRTIRAAQ